MKKLNLLLSLFFALNLSFAQPGTIGTGVVAHYSFDNGSLADSTQSRLDWFCNVPQMAGPDRFGMFTGALVVNNTNPTTTWPALPLVTNTAALPLGSSQRTISVWFRASEMPASGLQNYAFIYYQGTESIGNGFGLAIGNNQVALIGYLNDLTANASFTINTWHHLAGSYDGQTAKIYLDGTLLASGPRSWNTGTQSAKLAYFNTSSTTCSGCNLPTTTYHNQFKGMLDDLTIYNRVLSNQEITALANNTATSIKQIEKKLAFTIYPNPTVDLLNIQWDPSLINPNETVQIVDITGRVLKERLVKSIGETAIDISDLSNGVYIVRIGNHQETVVKK